MRACSHEDSSREEEEEEGDIPTNPQPMVVGPKAHTTHKQQERKKVTFWQKQRILLKKKKKNSTWLLPFSLPMRIFVDTLKKHCFMLTQLYFHICIRLTCTLPQNIVIANTHACNSSGVLCFVFFFVQLVMYVLIIICKINNKKKKRTYLTLCACMQYLVAIPQCYVVVMATTKRCTSTVLLGGPVLVPSAQSCTEPADVQNVLAFFRVHHITTIT